jgi:hypothetical protein
VIKKINEPDAAVTHDNAYEAERWGIGDLWAQQEEIANCYKNRPQYKNPQEGCSNNIYVHGTLLMPNRI